MAGNQMRDQASALKDLGLQFLPKGHEFAPGNKLAKMGPGRLGSGNELGKIFRKATRELLIEKEIQDLIRKRVIMELRGDLGLDGRPVEVRVVPIMMKIAGAQYNPKPTGDERMVNAPSIHLHLERLTDDELEAFVMRGIRPAAMKDLGAGTDAEDR